VFGIERWMESGGRTEQQNCRVVSRAYKVSIVAMTNRTAVARFDPHVRNAKDTLMHVVGNPMESRREGTASKSSKLASALGAKRAVRRRRSWFCDASGLSIKSEASSHGQSFKFMGPRRLATTQGSRLSPGALGRADTTCGACTAGTPEPKPFLSGLCQQAVIKCLAAIARERPKCGPFIQFTDRQN
jgi:hypothetical protein